MVVLWRAVECVAEKKMYTVSVATRGTREWRVEQGIPCYERRAWFESVEDLGCNSPEALMA